MPSDEPITIASALAAGMTRDQLRSGRWRAPFSGVRIDAAAPDDLATRSRCLLSVMPPDTVLSGATAAALRGWWLPAQVGEQLEVTVGRYTPRVRRDGVRCRQSNVGRDFQELFNGLPVTNALRTFADLSSRLHVIDLVVAADSALRTGALTEAELADFAATAEPCRAIRTLRNAVRLADRRSESPMETLLRLVIVLPGLPAPIPQAPIFDSDGGWLARADLKARGVKAVFEYDGATHNEPARHASDIARWKVLRRHGFEVYPYTARELFRMPQQIVLDYQRVLGLPPDPTVVDRWLRESRRSLWCTPR